MNKIAWIAQLHLIYCLKYALGLVTYDDSDGSRSDDDSDDDYGTSRQKNDSDDDSESELKVSRTHFCVKFNEKLMVLLLFSNSENDFATKTIVRN